MVDYITTSSFRTQFSPELDHQILSTGTDVRAPTHATVGVGEKVYLKNFTRGDGLDPMYQGPYQVLDFRHPNVKIDKGNGKTSWVHNCKIIPLVAGGAHRKAGYSYNSRARRGRTGSGQKGSASISVVGRSKKRETTVRRSIRVFNVTMIRVWK